MQRVTTRLLHLIPIPCITSTRSSRSILNIFARDHEHDGDDDSAKAPISLNVISGYSFSEGRQEQVTDQSTANLLWLRYVVQELARKKHMFADGAPRTHRLDVPKPPERLGHYQKILLQRDTRSPRFRPPHRSEMRKVQLHAHPDVPVHAVCDRALSRGRGAALQGGKAHVW
jgi:hypothetical protein